MIKKLILAAIISVIAPLSVGASEQMDSLSYALGDMIANSVIATELTDSLGECSDSDKADFIAAMEYVFSFRMIIEDSVSVVSFNMGCLQAVPLNDLLISNKDKDGIILDCVVAGLRSVVNNELQLPVDTIGIREYFHRFPSGVMPSNLPAEERCQFYTYYGMMKGLPPIHLLEQLIKENTGKSAEQCPADSHAYAAGFMLMLEVMNGNESNSPTCLGKSIAFSLLMQDLHFTLKTDDFLQGCRAGAGLEERKLTKEEVDALAREINKRL